MRWLPHVGPSPLVCGHGQKYGRCAVIQTVFTGILSRSRCCAPRRAP
ncbi:hypothetical protein SXIM_16130 [Streptomyces xiamenensis]|uniref:Uncharacterized protein n=1 Tax=Streptomyces xiamenensis TaxID=408015 RepID=A0A0F7FTG0_9ACTN|nr:hypothetical protein SXIM_16130 [Streptomyces xiamenensis]